MEFEKENKFLRKENEQLKEQYKKVTGEDFDIQKYLDLGISKASIAKLIDCHAQTLYNYIEKRSLKGKMEI